MRNLELISYKEYPQDPYTKAVTTIRIDGKHVVSYAKKMTKSGNEFWSSPSANVIENGEKVFISGYMPDSRSDEKQIMDFVKNCGKLPHKASPSAHATPVPARSMDEVADAQGMPF